MKERTLNRMFLNRIEEGGNSVRYLVPHEGKWDPMTYREVGSAVREMASGLMALGLSRGDKVAIISATKIEWCLADIAGILGGFVTVPVYPSSLPDQVEYILANSQSRVVFVEDEIQGNKVAGIRKNLPSLATVVMFSGDSQGKEGT
ncbi:MAG: AMP-binding protein, partial [Candidatus Deferrimicrobiaceae bacterium]